MSQIVTVIAILVFLYLIFCFIVIDLVFKQTRRLRRKERKIDKQVVYLVTKLGSFRLRSLVKKNPDVKKLDLLNPIIESMGQCNDIANTKNSIHQTLFYIEKHPNINYLWLSRKLNYIYKLCKQANFNLNKIKKYQKLLPSFLRNLPYRNAYE